jgi:hypothetical protein
MNPNPSPLANLSIEQKEQLLAWLELYAMREVLEKVAAPAPDGFGIKTYPTTLRRFFARHRVTEPNENSELANHLLKTVDTSSNVDSATAHSVRQIAFELSNSPGITAKQFKTLSRWVLRMRDQEHADQHLALARERLALERAKFEFNAAREALNHHTQLGQILADPHADDEAKIQAARERIFGKESIDRINAQERHKSE